MTPRKPPKAHDPAPYDEAVVVAINAMRQGVANEAQQKLGMQWIEYVACDVEGMSYFDQSDGGERATAFHEGRRFVGNQIRKMSNPITLAAKAVAKARNPRSERQSDG